MNEDYLALGRAIAGLCPPGFRTAKLQADYRDGPPRLAIAAVAADGTGVRPHIGPEARAALIAPLDAVRAAMAAADGKAWRTCTVTLTKGGGFTIDVGAQD
jgi:hypothetical protein